MMPAMEAVVVRPVARRQHVDQLRAGDDRRGAAPEPVEQPHELWHLGRLDAHRQPGADRAADEQAGPEDERREDLEPQNRDEHGEEHPARGDQVPACRRPGVSHVAQPLDEQHARDQVRELERLLRQLLCERSCTRHLSSAPGTARA